MGKILVIKGADFSAVAVGTVTPIAGKVAITVVASPSGGGTVTGSGSYDEGSTVTITATAADGYRFSKWADGNTNASRQITVGASAATYTAQFVDSNLFNKDEDGYEQGKYINPNGGLNANSSYHVTNYIPFTGGKLVLNEIMEYSGGGSEAGYDENKNFVKAINSTLVTSRTLNYSTFEDSTIKYVRMSFCVKKDHTIDEIRIVHED